MAKEGEHTEAMGDSVSIPSQNAYLNVLKGGLVQNSRGYTGRKPTACEKGSSAVKPE